MRVPELNKQNIQLLKLYELKKIKMVQNLGTNMWSKKKILVVTKSYLNGCLTIPIYSIKAYYTQYVGVSKNRGTPKWKLYNGKPY